MLYTILTVDIDQFELVTEITDMQGGLCSIDLTSLNDYQFIPAEFFELNIECWFEENLTSGKLLENLLKVPWSRRNKFIGACGKYGVDNIIISEYSSNKTGPGSLYYRLLKGLLYY